jgi:hypothetical protein
MGRAAALGGPHQPSRLIVERDDRLAQHRTVDEGDDAHAGLEFRVGDEAGDKSRMQRTDVADRRPDVARGCDATDPPTTGDGERTLTTPPSPALDINLAQFTTRQLVFDLKWHRRRLSSCARLAVIARNFATARNRVRLNQLGRK